MLHFKLTHYVSKINFLINNVVVFTFKEEISEPIFAFHILIVLSPDPLTTVYPSGENATLIT